MQPLTTYLFLLSSILLLLSANTERPNIIFILVDDMGYADLECFGSDFNETPNINRMAANGMKFTSAYASAPICSPTRAAYMTGQYPVRSGITDFIKSNSADIWLDPEKFITINEPLQNAGYKTCHLGKWHLDGGHHEGLGSPQRHTFDNVIGSETNYIGPGYYFHPYKHVSSFKEAVVQNEYLSEGENEFLTDRLFHEAIHFIQENQEQPFFVNLSLYSVHTNFEAPNQLVEKYIKKYESRFGKGSGDIFRRIHKGKRPSWKVINEKKLAKNCEPVLAAMLENIDHNLGLLLAKLKEMGKLENTLILLTSDNGGLPVNNNGGLKGDKSWIYEGGIRVPLIMHWPQQIKPGTLCNEPLSTVDMYPTFSELAQATLDSTYKLDGTSLTPLMSGQTLNRKEIFWHYSSKTMNWKARKGTALRQGKWKCIHWYGTKKKRTELFNLEEDPFETNNLANQMPELKKKMMTRIREWRKECGVDIVKNLPNFPHPAKE